MLKILMQLGSIIVFFTVLLSIISPIHLNTNTSETGEFTAIATLNVCHSDAERPALSLDTTAISDPLLYVISFFQELIGY